MPEPTRIARASALALLVAGCAAAPPPLQPGEARIVRAVELESYETREECMRLVVGDRLDWDWKADRPTSFHIVYIDGNARIAPIGRERLTEDSGIFAPALTRDYCASWEAGPAGALLDYRLKLRAVPR